MWPLAVAHRCSRELTPRFPPTSHRPRGRSRRSPNTGSHGRAPGSRWRDRSRHRRLVVHWRTHLARKRCGYQPRATLEDRHRAGAVRSHREAEVFESGGPRDGSLHGLHMRRGWRRAFSRLTRTNKRVDAICRDSDPVEGAESGTKIESAGPCEGSSENSPRSLRDRRHARTVKRTRSLASSRRPCRVLSGMSVGLATRKQQAVVGAAPSSAARPGLIHASRLRPARPARSWKARNRSSMPKTLHARRGPPAVLVHDRACQREHRHGRRDSGARDRPAASASRKKLDDETTTSVAPSRASASSRRLARTEAPTSSAPASTATATATPAIDERVQAAIVTKLRKDERGERHQ